MTDFPILDGTYAAANSELGRTVLDSCGVLEPYIDETDCWVTAPLRLVHDRAAGIHLEIGPYSVDSRDIERLRAALRAYDITVRGTGIRRMQ